MIAVTYNQKKLLALLASLFFITCLFFQAGLVRGEAVTHIEIFFLPHRPALAVVSEVEKIVTESQNIVIKKYNFEDPAAQKLLKKYHLTSHMPVAIYINGQNTFTINKKQVTLRNFPKGDAFVPMFAGKWDYEDLRTILKEISGAK